MKSAKSSLIKPINEQGVFFYATSGKFTVRVKIKNKFTNLKACVSEREALDFYADWLKKNG